MALVSTPPPAPPTWKNAYSGKGPRGWKRWTLQAPNMVDYNPDCIATAALAYATVEPLSSYDDEINEWTPALLSSMCTDGKHRPILDLDSVSIHGVAGGTVVSSAATAITVLFDSSWLFFPSSTDGNYHGYCTDADTWENCVELLNVLLPSGIVDAKWVQHCKDKGYMSVRHPMGAVKDDGTRHITPLCTVLAPLADPAYRSPWLTEDSAFVFLADDELDDDWEEDDWEDERVRSLSDYADEGPMGDLLPWATAGHVERTDLF